MKIVFLVTRSDNIGGSHIHVRDMAVRLQKNGHDVNVLIGGNGPVVKQFCAFNINVINIPTLCRNISPLNDINALFTIRKHLKRIQPDLISTHSSKAGFLGRIAAKTLKIPVIFTAHGWSYTSGKTKKSRRIFMFLEKSVVSATDYFITVSDYDRQLGLRFLNIPEDKITTVHNGMPDVAENLRANPGVDGEMNIVKVARFDKQKNHKEFLYALKGLEGIRVHFVGTGPLEESCRKLADELGISEKITFWGSRDDVDKILSEGQLFALISNWEGFPRSTIEAMRAGLPVIVSDVGGAGEAVDDGINGYIIKQGDIDTLRKRINELASSPKKRKQIGNASRKYYEKHLTFDRMYHNTLKIYELVLKDRS